MSRYVDRQCDDCGTPLVNVFCATKCCEKCARVRNNAAARKHKKRKREAARATKPKAPDRPCQDCGATMEAPHRMTKWCGACSKKKHREYSLAGYYKRKERDPEKELARKKEYALANSENVKAYRKKRNKDPEHRRKLRDYLNRPAVRARTQHLQAIQRAAHREKLNAKSLARYHEGQAEQNFIAGLNLVHAINEKKDDE